MTPWLVAAAMFAGLVIAQAIAGAGTRIAQAIERERSKESQG